MRSIITVASLLLLGTGSFAQYGSGYGSGYDDNSGTPISSVDDNSGTPVSSVRGEKPSSSASPVVAIPAISSAVSSSLPTSDSSSPAGQVEVHRVKVSNKAGDLTFEPNDLKVQPGSMVQFQFYPKKHSVVQSTFDQPCIPIHNVNKSVTGFFSGFMPVEKGAKSLPTYTIMVNDTKPIWFYCSQGDHCQDGMVGVINAPATNKSRTITTYAELAKKAPNNITPSLDPGTGGDSSESSGSSSYGSSNSSVSPSSTFLAGTGTGTGAIIQATSTSSTSGPSVSSFKGAANTFTGKQSILGGAGLAGAFGFAIAFAL